MTDLPGVTTARMLEEMMRGYEVAFEDDLEREVPRPAQVKAGMRSAVQRTWKHLARERMENTRPKLPLGKHFWQLSKAERQAIGELCETPGIHALVTSLKGRLIDVKQAVAAAAPRVAHATMPRDNGKRVVEGARQLSPALGNRMLAVRMLDHSFFIRELLPQDLKLELDELSAREAMSAAAYLARVVGRAHARQMDLATRVEWMSDLQRNRTRTLDAPSWLWRSEATVRPARG